VRITACTINDALYSDYDSEGLFVNLPSADEAVRVKVTLTPVS
jgi:hypothetical protein